ncbi:hypothetical protein OBBRIDRAFT_789126 [Obba rivulosa]|uniref:Uncharacterized protein n=1 Tax=Obba rivulosa TaxID=1052685 RepID=A0A8E2DS15_9APHY|nr:hypothetical protein OBBRIDRAFT_789126 [Obba rivulosa]
MDEKRAKTLQALSTYIESQKALLAQTQADIGRLKELREELATSSEVRADYILPKLQGLSLSSYNQDDLVAPIPKDLDWSVFRGCDPERLKDLAANARAGYARRNEPSKVQQSELSELQRLVRDARTTIVEPVLSSFHLPPDLIFSDDDEPEAPDPGELRRAREREKIRELKKRRFDNEDATPVFSGLRRPRMAEGVFVRQDVEDESALVDISFDGKAEDVDPERSAVESGSEMVHMDVDTPPTSVASPASAVSGLPALFAQAAGKTSMGRERRGTKKSAARPHTTSAPASRVQESSRTKGKAREEPVEMDTDPIPADEPPAPSGKKGKDKGRPKSETYKQAWSISEQHLLERLLEEIPEGEKNRWSKISKAMNGRRTARQVASRVQKYYEKLKRFGLDVGGSKNGS